VAVCALAFIAQNSATAPVTAQERPPLRMSVEPFIWQFDEDYIPEAPPSDSDLGVRTVYIKTHDGLDWMSKWDESYRAISGPDALRRIVGEYRAHGIETVAWFVPQMTDLRAQLDYAEAVLDTGVTALYADVEPYDGFCHNDCAYLGEYFWKTLRAERPNARLGVIYDPRPLHWEDSKLATWIQAADVALPMCYWDSFVDQPPWNSPEGCIRQAHADLGYLAGGKPVEFVPIAQGNSSPDKVREAVATVESLGGSRVSLWRRGEVPAEVWSAVAEFAQPVPAPASTPSPTPVPDSSRSTILALIEELRNKVPRSKEDTLRLMQLIELAKSLHIRFF
jgi:hypothetical protein